MSFEDEKKNAATIEAKPQIKNPLGDVTRFMPTTLRIKRQDAKTAAKAAANRKSSPGVQSKLRMKSINLFCECILPFDSEGANLLIEHGIGIESISLW